jgi:SAM-dependent methyltransferase
MVDSRRTAGNDERHTVRAQTIARFAREAAEFQQRYEAVSAGGPGSAFAYARVLLDEALAGVLAGLPARSRILDAGCGTGHYLRRMRDLGHDVVGVEPAAPMRAAARRLNPDAPILDAVISDLPFGDHSFDLVVAIEVLRYLHAADIRAALEEMIRVTRPGGRVVVTAVNQFAMNPFYAYCAIRRVLSRYTGVSSPLPCEFTTARKIREEFIGLGADDIAVLPWVVIPLVRPLYRLHPAAGRFMAGIMRPYERALCRQYWATGVAGGLIIIARRAGAGT